MIRHVMIRNVKVRNVSLSHLRLMQVMAWYVTVMHHMTRHLGTMLNGKYMLGYLI
jgi:hypothetical protein